MNLKHAFHAAVISATLFFPASLFADDAPFYTRDPMDIVAQLPPPPSDDSPAGMADLETILQVQKDRTPEQVKRATSVAGNTTFSMGAHVFGPEFTPENLPRVSAILYKARLGLRKVLQPAKKNWSRERPSVRDGRVEPCVAIPKANNYYSYPSGHSSAEALFFAFYSEAMPEYAALFEDYVRETMWCRVIGGVHYPTDTQAGNMLGKLVAEEMLKNQSTRNAIAEMRTEILDFLKKHPDALESAEAAKKKAARR
ncbi:acid phosphatase (class A) [Ereboglobus sp. PH5-10]|uniref:phosphatase PAP2 family protein n=1 Tax=Ereboglobus sp. PH5-10 TaxID=2940629 RepID=UPI0024066F84|nr:phosphatase PAP2 family protein [Ereboglobus sp. PH5-10]MDF9825963.1 acid phosphatase (class A) [Ereboglobus sp. PH5-10]